MASGLDELSLCPSPYSSWTQEGTRPTTFSGPLSGPFLDPLFDPEVYPAFEPRMQYFPRLTHLWEQLIIHTQPHFVPPFCSPILLQHFDATGVEREIVSTHPQG